MEVILIICGYILVWWVLMPFLYKTVGPWLVLHSDNKYSNLKIKHKKQMRELKDIENSTLYKMLHDPNVTIEDMEKFKQKSKIAIETVQLAQKAETEQLAQLAKGLASGKIG